MNLGHAQQHAVPPLQALHARRRHLHAADRPLAGGHSQDAQRPARTQPGHLIDIMATVVDVTGAEVPDGVQRPRDPADGRRQPLPAFAGKPLERASTDLLGARRQPRDPRRQVEARDEVQGAWELYDIEADRTEQNNLAERRPDVVKDLSARWEAWAKRTHTDQWIGPRRNDWGEVPRP